MKALQFDVPKANIKPKKHKIKFQLVKISLHASLKVHYYVFGLIYLLPHFLCYLLNNTSGDSSLINMVNITPKAKQANET